jgi:hypothetical protein
VSSKYQRPTTRGHSAPTQEDVQLIHEIQQRNRLPLSFL